MNIIKVKDYLGDFIVIALIMFLFTRCNATNKEEIRINESSYYVERHDTGRVKYIEFENGDAYNIADAQQFDSSTFNTFEFFKDNLNSLRKSEIQDNINYYSTLLITEIINRKKISVISETDFKLIRVKNDIIDICNSYGIENRYNLK